MTYQAPVDDILAALKTSGRFDDLAASGVMGDVDLETVRAILEEAGNLATDVLDPLNQIGDTTGSRIEDGEVLTPPGWKAAYDRFVEGGWPALGCPPEFGGQGLPVTVAMAVTEIWNSANVAFAMCPLLTNGAIDSLHIGGSDALKAQYLPQMISGAWTGTMNLTEPQAGSDLNAVATKAVKQDDGSYRVTGTKIFISYGEHDLTENIIHLVLARLPDAPPGTRGISLFLVPKVLVNSDGSLGASNDVVCTGIEHKLGIRASPTAVLKFGEKGGAVGYLVGEENRGLVTMFIMMNAARLAVGVQGVAVAERATQRAIAYANERRQGRGAASQAGEMVPIVQHADIRRTLMTMKALTAAARAICLATAAATDVAERGATDEARADAAQQVALLTPITKAFSTDIAVEVGSLGIQVHGGMGYVEETGAAQYLRDARILPIYEGTNGIQAMDLVMRKLPLGGGAVVKAYLAEMAATVEAVQSIDHEGFGRMGTRLQETIAALGQASKWMGAALQGNTEAALASATPYLRLFALAAGGHYLAQSALAAADGDDSAMQIKLARFFCENICVAGPGLAASVMEGSDGLLALSPDTLSA